MATPSGPIPQSCQSGEQADPNSPTEMFAVPTAHRGVGPSTRTERFPQLREDHDLPKPVRDELVSLLGSHGADPALRLGLSPDSDPREIAATARRMLQVWRDRSTDPALTARGRKLCGIAVATCEEILKEIEKGAPGPLVSPPAADDRPIASPPEDSNAPRDSAAARETTSTPGPKVRSAHPNSLQAVPRARAGWFRFGRGR